MQVAVMVTWGVLLSLPVSACRGPFIPCSYPLLLGFSLPGLLLYFWCTADCSPREGAPAIDRHLVLGMICGRRDELSNLSPTPRSGPCSFPASNGAAEFDCSFRLS